MAYASPQDIATIYGGDFFARLLDANGDGQAEAGAADQALVYAAAQINSYIGGRYVLPLPATPELVRMLAVDIAVYRLAQDHGRLTDEIIRRYDDAMRQLRDLSSGRAVLPVPSAGAGSPEVAAPSPSIVMTDAADQHWDRKRLRRL